MTRLQDGDLLHGSVPRQLIAFSLPFLAANILQSVYSTVDMIIVGQFVGSHGLSAVSIGGEFMAFFTFIGLGFAQAGQIMISQSVGAGNRDRISRIIGTMFVFILALSLVITAVSLVFIIQRPVSSRIRPVYVPTVCLSAYHRASGR